MHNIQTVCYDAFGSFFSIVPLCIKDMLTSVADMPGHGRLRSTASGSFDVPRVRTCSQAFSVAEPQAWNSLPMEMRNASMTQSVSKNRVKTFLFEQAYPTIGRLKKKILETQGV